MPTDGHLFRHAAPSRRNEWWGFTLFVLPVLISLSVACGGASEDEVDLSSEPGRGQVLLKGRAVFGHEVRSLRPCGGEETLWAIDSTGLLWDLHKELAPGIEPYEEVFVVVRGTSGAAPPDGFGAEYAGTFVVDQVLYAAVEGFGCELDLDSFQFRLSGNEPFWTLWLANGSAELSRINASSSTWADVRLQRTEQGFSYAAEGNDQDKLEVSVTEAPCRDSMSGAFHGYRANVVIPGDTLEGCALRGTAAFRPG